MMKKILFVSFIFVLTIGCKVSQSKSNCKELQDSLVVLVQQGTLHNDTTLLQKALVLSDSLLSVDTTRANRKFCYYHRSMILSSRGTYGRGFGESGTSNNMPIRKKSRSPFVHGCEIYKGMQK